MSIFGLSKRKETRSNETIENTGITYVNPNSLTNSLSFYLEGLRYSPMNLSTVYRCVEIISDSIAMLPIYVTRNGKEVKNNISLLFNPHYRMIKCAIQQVLLHGNGFLYITRASDGKPVSLRFLKDSDVSIQYNENTDDLFYIARKVSNKKILPKDMIHFMKYSLDGVHGLSVLNFASKAVKLAVSSEEAANSYYESGGNLTGLLMAKTHSTQEQRQEAKKAFLNNMKSGSVSVLPQEFDYKSIQMNSEEAQLLESREFSVKDLARFFGVPSSMLGIVESNKTTESEMSQFLMQTLLPWIKILEEELTSKLCTGNTVINLDESYLIKTDKTSESTYYTSLVNSGILSVNECREAIGFAPIEGGDVHMVAYSDVNQNSIENKDNKDNTKDGSEENNTEEQEA